MYSPWTDGIDLLEACDRCHLTEVAPEFLGHVYARRLILYTRLSSSEYVRVDERKIERIDVRASTAITATKSHEVVAFPALKSPHRIELISGYSLVEAFHQYVLSDPEVRALSRQAMSVAPELERVFDHGRYTPHGVSEWPVNLEYSYIGGIASDDSVVGCLLRKREAAEAILAVDALKDRYAALIMMLQRNEIEAYGFVIPSMQLQTLLRSLWAHRGIEIDFHNGDVYSVQKADGLEPRQKKLWTGVMLRPALSEVQLELPAALASQDKVFHVNPIKHDPERPIPAKLPHPLKAIKKLTPHQAGIEAAVAALWPEGIPASMPVQVRDQKIATWQHNSGTIKASSKTIRRFLKERNG